MTIDQRIQITKLCRNIQEDSQEETYISNILFRTQSISNKSAGESKAIFQDDLKFYFFLKKNTISYLDRRSFPEGTFHLNYCKSNQEPPELVKSQILGARH